MAQLQFSISNQIIERTDDFDVVAQSYNYLYAKFNFLTDEWTGRKTAIFRNNGNKFEILLNDNDECVVPHEALSGEDQYILVSVFCGDLVTANTARVFVERSGYGDDLESAHDPTPSVYQQILDELEYAKHNVDGGLFTDWQE